MRGKNQKYWSPICFRLFQGGPGQGASEHPAERPGSDPPQVRDPASPQSRAGGESPCFLGSYLILNQPLQVTDFTAKYMNMILLKGFANRKCSGSGRCFCFVFLNKHSETWTSSFQEEDTCHPGPAPPEGTGADTQLGSHGDPELLAKTLFQHQRGRHRVTLRSTMGTSPRWPRHSPWGRAQPVPPTSHRKTDPVSLVVSLAGTPTLRRKCEASMWTRAPRPQPVRVWEGRGGHQGYLLIYLMEVLGLNPGPHAGQARALPPSCALPPGNTPSWKGPYTPGSPPPASPQPETVVGLCPPSPELPGLSCPHPEAIPSPLSSRPAPISRSNIQLFNKKHCH
nr:uncharacterized protein C6orf132 homolog [Vicugna pacos]